MDYDAELTEFLAAIRSFGASDAALAAPGDGPSGLPVALSVAVRLSPYVIAEILETDPPAPTYTYFNHYRSVNALIDQILLKAGLLLQDRGASWVSAAASQSRPDSPFEGRYSHKKAAVLAGLGTIGLNNLFLHREWGARVRLGTLFTDWGGAFLAASETRLSDRISGSSRELGSSTAPANRVPAESRGPYLSGACEGCGRCVAACPCGAIGAGEAGERGLVAFDPKRCSDWMKKAYQSVGRGAVCGICVAVCPAAKN